MSSKEDTNGCDSEKAAEDDENDCASVMSVISGVKPVVYDMPCQESESVPKMGVRISPDLELKLEKVSFYNIIIIDNYIRYYPHNFSSIEYFINFLF